MSLDRMAKPLLMGVLLSVGLLVGVAFVTVAIGSEVSRYKRGSRHG